MCWIESKRNLDIQIADKDIEVYKVVSKADKQSCESVVQGFVYAAKLIYKMGSIKMEQARISDKLYDSNIVYVNKAYHSYTKIRFTLKKPGDPYPKHEYKGIIAGNLLMPIRIDNPYYVATFVIPKGSQYAINWKGEIVSNQIIYTGKHLKL